jgi:hypothetical protein
MTEKLSFSGEVLDSKVGLPQAEIKRTENSTINLVKMYNPETFKILVHTEGVSLTSSEKFFKFYLNGNVEQSSAFSPKEVLEITIQNRIWKQPFVKELIQKFCVFEIKFYNRQQELLEEIYTLTFHLFYESRYWGTELANTINPILKSFLEHFKSASSFFSLVEFHSSETIPVLTSYCTISKFFFKFSNEFVFLHFREISNIFLTRNSLKINMRNSKCYTFGFKSKWIKDINHLLNFISFVFGIEIFGLCSFPKLFMDIDLVDFSWIPFQKELCVQQKNYLQYFTCIEKNAEFKILVVDLHTIEIPQFEQSVMFKVLINSKICYTHSISNIGRIYFDLSVQRLVSKDEIELLFYQIDKSNTIEDELFFRHKIYLIEGVLAQEKEFDKKEEQKTPKKQQSQENLNLIEFPKIPELTQSPPPSSKMNTLKQFEIQIFSETPKKTSISSWSVDTVCQWIRRLGSVYEEKKYDSMFRKFNIDGEALLKIEKNDLKEMGINLMGDRINLMTEIKKLK